MAWLVRAVSLVLAVLVMINGGYWELHRHLWAGMVMVILGIAGIMLLTGANAAHVPDETDEMRLE